MTTEENPGGSTDGEPEEPAEPDANPADAVGDDGPVDLSGAFINAGPDIKLPNVGPGIDFGKLGIFDGILGAMEKVGNLGLASEPPYLAALNALTPPVNHEFEMPEVYFDDSPQRTAAAAEDTAEAARETAEYTAALLAAMKEGVVLNEQTRQDNIAAQRFTRRMSVASLVLSIVGVVFAGVSLVVAAQPGPAPIVNVPPDPAPTINVTVVPTPEPTTPAP